MLKQILIPAKTDGGPCAGTRLSDVLAAKGYPFATPCGGRGSCGKCRVTLLAGTVSVGGTEITANEPTEVLACQCVLTGGVCTFLVPVTEGAGLTETGAARSDASEIALAGIALDIGTTTLAMALVATDGTVCKTVSRLNPEMAFGADVMSRIGKVMEDADALATMQGLLLSAVREMASELCGDGASVSALTVVGNTTMLHIFLGVSPVGMGAYPFTPVFTDAKTLPGAALDLPFETVTVLPCAKGSAFIGADITAGVLVSEMTEQNETAMLIDVGTNGEMVLYRNGTLLGASTAAGPAMEGAGISSGVGGIPGAVCSVRMTTGGETAIGTVGNAAPVGICGSGLIDLVAVMLDCGTIDETGYMEDGTHTYAKTADGSTLALTDGDIRAFQLAKSAIRAGMEALCDAAGIAVTALAQIYLAGGLGYYMNVASAMRVGLLPRLPQSRIKSLGNAALAGAIRYLTDAGSRETLSQIAARIETVELNASPVFSEAFMEHMLFPEDAE